MKKTPVIVLLVMLVAGMFASGAVLLKRMAFEAENRTVELVVDYRDLLDSMPLDTGPAEALGRIEALGVTTIGVYEDDIQSLSDAGAVRVIPRSRIGRFSPIAGDTAASIIFSSTPDVQNAIHSMLPAYFGPETCPAGMQYCFAPVTGDRLRGVTLGLPALETRLAIAPRLGNSPYETPESVILKLRQVAALPNVSVVIFDGDSVIGFPRLVDKVGEEMLEKGIKFGWVEMVEQNGAGALRSAAAKNMIPVHSISEGEMLKTTPEERIERFARAARERGIRMLYLHLPVEGAGASRNNLAAENIEYIAKVKEAVERAGFTVGRAEPMPDFDVSPVLRALVFGGLAAFCLLLLSLTFNISPALLAAAGALCYPAYAAAIRVGFESAAVKLGALGAACLVPACALALGFLRGKADEKKPRTLDFGATVAAWMQAVMLTTLGGFFIAALLSRREFFLRIDVFFGVKLAYALPLLLAAYFYCRWSGISARDFLDRPVRYAEAAALMALAAAIGVYLLRSGNEAASLATGVEKEMRGWLEALLVVRPRTKEFLIGHPAMIVAGLIPFARASLFPAAVLMVGAMALVGITNTFCHLHTPFALSLARTAMGIVLGAAFGFTARWAIQAALTMLSRKK